MLLQKLTITDLHDALDLSVKFNEDTTLLVGINGCGKTSVLNVIDWLLKPDLKRLALANYSELALDFIVRGKRYNVKARKTKTLVTLSITAKDITVAPITVKLLKNINPDNVNDEEIYDGLMPEPKEMPMLELLKSFTKPTVITLDRTISAEVEEVSYVELARGGVKRSVRARSPLTYVQEVTSEKFADYRAMAIQNDNELKARIVMSALQDPEVIFKGGEIKSMNRREISLILPL